MYTKVATAAAAFATRCGVADHVAAFGRARWALAHSSNRILDPNRMRVLSYCALPLRCRRRPVVSLVCAVNTPVLGTM